MSQSNYLAGDYSEFFQRVKDGLYESPELAMFVMEHLMDPGQAAWMYKEKLTLEGIFSGQFTGDQEPTLEAIFKDWNMKCGTVLFAVGGLHE